MPTPDEIVANKERLYESSSLRDDLNDAEATILLEWGQGQVDRIAAAFPDDFSQKARFLRQVIKGINRFVGQREFNDRAGQEKYMDKITKYLPHLGWDGVTDEMLFAALPEDRSAMLLNLRAILRVLDGAIASEEAVELPEVPSDQGQVEVVSPDVSEAAPITDQMLDQDVSDVEDSTNTIDQSHIGANQGHEPEE